MVEITNHIYSQEDTSFYFSDCVIASRADSFELLRIGKYIKFFNAPNLSRSEIDEVRLLYSRALDVPYFISLKNDGVMTILTVDSVSYVNATEEYQYIDDTLHFSDFDKKVMRFTGMYRWYLWHKIPDSAAILKKNYPEFIDSLYDLHLRLTSRIPLNDTITIIKTTLHRQLETYNDIVEKIESIDFWNMPFYEDGGANDGSSWTLEAKINGRHHLSCKVNVPNKAFEEVCKMLLKFTSIPPKDIY